MLCICMRVLPSFPVSPAPAFLPRCFSLPFFLYYDEREKYCVRVSLCEHVCVCVCAYTQYVHISPASVWCPAAFSSWGHERFPLTFLTSPAFFAVSKRQTFTTCLLKGVRALSPFLCLEMATCSIVTCLSGPPYYITYITNCLSIVLPCCCLCNQAAHQV